MMSDLLLECARHGPGVPYGYVCRHLLGTGRVGWFEADGSDLCPDAWCGECEELRAMSGGWTDESGAMAGVKVVCACCYHERRGWQHDFPSLDASSARALAITAHRTIQARNDRLEDEHQVFSMGAWHFEPEQQQLDFSEDGTVRYTSRVAMVGSYSEVTSTWLWAWDNRDLGAQLAARSHAVVGFAGRTGRVELQVGKVNSTLDEAWQSASIGAVLMEAQGLYRCPYDHLHVFLAILDLSVVEGLPSRT